MMLIALSNTIGLQISVSYAIDSYRELAGESMITGDRSSPRSPSSANSIIVIIIRNTMSFAINYGLTPWVTVGQLHLISALLEHLVAALNGRSHPPPLRAGESLTHHRTWATKTHLLSQPAWVLLKY